MKVIFLDIDGVLNTTNGLRAALKRTGKAEFGKRVSFDHEAVKNLNRLIQQTGAKIVVSSTWRYGETIDTMQQVLHQQGVMGKVVGFTPDSFQTKNGIWQSPERGKEIQKWLDQQAELIHYVILDDDDSGMPIGQRKRLVKCSMMDGFGNDERYREALSILHPNSTQSG